MIVLEHTARRPHVLPPAWTVLAVAALLVTGCRPVGGVRPEADAPEAAGPAITSGASSAVADSAAAALITGAEAALDAGRYEDALRDATTVVERYPTASGSSRALAVQARASLAQEAFGDALAASARYAALFPASDPRAAEATLLAAQASHGQGETEDAVLRLAGVPAEVVPTIEAEAVPLMRTMASRLDSEALLRVAEEVVPGPLTAPVLAEAALAAHYRGDQARARALAGDIQGLALDGPEAEVARAILDGRVDELGGAVPVLGAMLPETGSPGLQEFSTRIREGIDVALRVHANEARRPVRLAVMDDQGSPTAADALVRRLEDDNALAIVGPLLNTSLEVAAAARTRGTVIVSPTSRRVPEGHPGVYTLAGPDPGPARALANYAHRQGYRHVVLLRPNSAAAIDEAIAFRETLAELGLPLDRELAYDSGSTFFEAPLTEVAELRPEALVLPIPASDVELLAPQVTFFGLDSLGIQVLGTAGWSAESVREAVDARHTAGVVTVTPTPPGQQPPGRQRFVEEFESQFRRTLRSPVPALGYDAAGLVLEALRRSGARTPADLRDAIENIEGYPGATGTLSVEDGRIVREHHLVRFDSAGVLNLLGPPEPG